MFLLDTAEKLLALVFFVSTMLSIGMQTRVTDLRLLLASRRFLLRTLLANFLIVPVCGVVLALLLPLPPHIKGALVLLACTPGGPSSVQFTGQVRQSAPLAGAQLGLLSFTAVFLSPLILKLLLPGDVQWAIPYGNALLALLVFLILPILAGMFLLATVPDAASKLSKLLVLIGVIAFIAFMVVTGDARKAAAGEVGALAVAAMLLFIFISMTVGWFLGGPTVEFRRIMAASTSMRNAALCLAIVESSSPGHAVIVPLVAFSLLMVPTNMLFSVYHTVRDRRKEKEALRSVK